MSDRAASITSVRAGSRIVSARATCHSCGSLLAIRGATVRLASGLVARPDKRAGLPRFGASRRRGRPREASNHLADASTRDVGNPRALYINCPNCDRGQVVRWPE